MEEQAQIGTQRMERLNPDQRNAFDKIVEAVNTGSGKTFFLHGPGGTGKTYVYNTLCYFLRGQGKIVLCVASSGIAALLLNGGRTSHSAFKIPIKIHETSTCSISKNSNLAELIQQTDLVIWDEAPMQHRHIHEAVDRTFCDIRNSEAAFWWPPYCIWGRLSANSSCHCKRFTTRCHWGLHPTFTSLAFGGDFAPETKHASQCGDGRGISFCLVAVRCWAWSTHH